jgi:hypothetical protein
LQRDHDVTEQDVGGDVSVGEKRKSGPAILTSVLPATADIRQRGGHIRKVPKAEMDNRSMIVVGAMRSPTLRRVPMS